MDEMWDRYDVILKFNNMKSIDTVSHVSARRSNDYPRQSPS